MKAIIRWSAGLLSLLLLSSVTHGYEWVSPVFKTPLGHAPSPSNSGFYFVDGYGRLTGPHYYLVPPFRPFGGMLPGPTGQAIMSGQLPHQLLMSKEGMALGNVPLVGQKKSHDEHSAQGAPGQGQGMPPMAGGSNSIQFGNRPPQQQAMHYGNSQIPYPTFPVYGPPMPYAGVNPYQQHPLMMQQRPIAYMPYYGQPGMYAMARQDPRTGVWQVQHVVPGQNPSPFRSIPGFTPGMGPAPMTQQPPMQPFGPTQQFGQMQPFPPQQFSQVQPFSPMPQQFSPFAPIQGPQPPQMNMEGMQGPRMEWPPPPPQQRPGAFPTHPFTRSPRDFFMWGENMEDERARAGRPGMAP